MPVSPYISQNSYASRPYMRANSSNYTPTTTTNSSYGVSKYYTGDSSATSTTTATPTYKTGGYGKSNHSPLEDISANKPPSYLAGRYKSSDSVPESQTLLELKLKKSSSNSSLLTGNTANILKNFNLSEDRSPKYIPPKARYQDTRPEERKFCGKTGGVSIFASHYLAKVNKDRNIRPREIDTRDINTTDKPRVTPGFDAKHDETCGAITRASRHVVRLTIKREELDDPFTVKDKTIKTIAQRLIEKYTDKEKKPDPYEYVPRKRLYEDNYNVEKYHKPVPAASSEATPSPSSIVTSAIASDATPNNASEDPTISTTSRKKSLADLRASGVMSPQSSFEDEGDVAFRLLRATSMAAKKKELQNSEEVKDAIIAAVLHPDVDIESDEEMMELVQGGDETKKSDAWGKESPKKEGEVGGGEDAAGDHSVEGKHIVGQLKRFVKKQVSTKGSGKKKSSRKKSRTSSKKSKKESKKLEIQSGESDFILSHKREDAKADATSPQKETSSKEEKEDSLLSADLILGANTTSKQKRSKDRSLKSSDGEKKESPHNLEGKKQSKESENKRGLSLLSTDLVLNNLTSDEENDSRQKPPIEEKKKKEASVNKEKAVGGEMASDGNDKPHRLEENEKTKEKSEKTASKIPKLKKKIKKAAVEETTEVLPEIKVSLVGSPSCTPPLKGPTDTEEKVTDFKEKRESEDTFSGINKKISSQTSPTGNSNETSDHHLESTSSVGTKNSIPGKEIKSIRSEKSSADDKKGKLSEEKSISDVSVELKTSKKSREREVAPGNKDEDAVRPGLFQKGGISSDNHPVTEIPKEKTNEAKEDGESGKEKKEETVKERRDTYEVKKSNIDKKSPCVTKTDLTIDSQLKDDNGLKKKPGLSKSAFIARWKLDEGKQVEPTNEKEVTNESKEKPTEATSLPTVNNLVTKEEVKKDDGGIEAKNNGIESGGITESKQEEAQADSLEGKKAIKRPRQVGPPPPQENKIDNADLLNMRKILKRPVKKIGAVAAPEEKQDQPTTPEDPNKKIWKRPIAQLVPPKEGDQFLQARNVLKKPVKPKIPAEDKGDKPTGKLPDMKKKLKKPGVAATAAQKDSGEKGDQKPRSRSPSSSDEEEEGEAKKGERPKRPMKPRPPSDKKTPPKTPPKAPSESPSNTTKLEGSGKDPKLSACQSADSGYGSSPSTPQPTQAPPDVKNEEICTVCGTNCHKKCEKQMANLCGVNQKLLAEALSSVKKAGSTDGTSRTLASPTKSSSVSGSESETTEEESETDTDTDYFGLPEIRPPLQSKPKFKRYTIDDFLFIKVLGKGSYGKVMLAQQKDSENYFAVKCLKKDVVLEDNDVECTLIERKVLSLGTKHPYLCHLFCTFQTPSHLFFVMEYLTGGDLMFHIQHCGRFDEFRACFYAAEITSGLKFLHSKGIIYRDLKLDNILLDYQGHIRIADFGMCKLQVYLDRYADTFCGTPDYMAPEVIKGQHYNQCVDWWSFGVLLYEMLTGKSPFKGCDEDHLFWLICNDEPFFPKFLSREATDILKGLLDKDSNKRLGIPFSPYGEIKDHAFFKYTDWCKIDRKEVETPYKPRLRHILDVQYFDRLFTKRHAAITPLDESILATMDQTAFTDFSYTNPNITD